MTLFLRLGTRADPFFQHMQHLPRRQPLLALIDTAQSPKSGRTHTEPPFVLPDLGHAACHSPFDLSVPNQRYSKVAHKSQEQNLDVRPALTPQATIYANHIPRRTPVSVAIFAVMYVSRPRRSKRRGEKRGMEGVCEPCVCAPHRPCSSL